MIDKSKLVKKTIVNKLGHRQTVYVLPRTKQDKIRKKVQTLMSKTTYNKTLKVLNSQIDNVANLEVQKMVLTNKALKLFANSPEQLKVREQIKAIHKKIKADKDKGQRALGAKLILLTGMRIGNTKSSIGQRAESGMKTYGASTLQKKHIKIKPDSVKIEFRGKKGVDRAINITSKKLANQIRTLYKKSKGATFLQVSPKMLADYIREELNVTPKDLRTLRANIIAKQVSGRIKKRPRPKTQKQANKELDEIAENVAKKLGNTKGVARRSYIDEDILHRHKKDRFKKAFLFELIETL